MLHQPASLRVLILALVLGVPVVARAAPLLAVLKSDGLESYGQVASGAASAAAGMEVAEFSLGGDGKKVDAVVGALLARKPALILALGPLAANAARRATGETPVIFAMVPNFEKYGLEAKNVTGIALTRPVEEQLATLHALLPAAKRVGVLYTPEYSQELIDKAAVTAQRLGLTLKAEPLGKGHDAADLAQKLADGVDALWLIADRGTSTVAASSALITAARKARVPLVALSEGQVREGALLAFTASPLSIGVQAGRLAARIALEHVDPGALAVAPPSGLDVWLSLPTFRAIGLDAAFTARLLDHVGQKGLALRVLP